MKTVFTIDDLKRSAVAGINQHIFTAETKKKAAKAAKYKNEKVQIDGKTFDSKKEARRYVELRMLESAKIIRFLNCQVVFELSVCKYIADFTYLNEAGSLVVEDVKSKATRRLSTYRLKKKLMKAELEIEIHEK